MKNIDSSIIKNLKNQSEMFYNVLGDADAWVTNHLKFEEKDQLSLKIKHSKRLVRKVKKSIESKPVFALFGISQAGKSYLVKNLLSINGAPLEIKLGQSSYDFLKMINPAGANAESTGVITRFSIDESLLDAAFPIKIKLLDVKDLILIICDSYFSDIKKIGEYPSVEKFKEHCDYLERKFKSQPEAQTILIEDDVLDIQDYFNRNFFKFSHIVDNINESNYWLRLVRIIKSIPSEEWVNSFAILWNKNEALSNLLTKLILTLENINYSPIVYAPAEAVLRGGGEILDVLRLKELNTNTKTIAVINEAKEKHTLNLCYLSALSVELTLCIPREVADTKHFLKNTDLLDFPGARSRLGIDYDLITQDKVPDMYLRGKIAYLFNKYSSDYEINNLLFCQNDLQLNVNEIPFLLNDWIVNNIGKNSEEREKSIKDLPVSPLFIVFTFFNNQIKYDSTNDDKEDISYKWDTRFHRSFEQDVVTPNHNWHVNWTKKNPVFKNFFLLRDFKYSNDSFAGFENGRKEGDVKNDRTEFFNKLKFSFLNHPFVKKHFDAPESTWNNSATPNNDGSDSIIEKLEPAANNYIKTFNYVTQLTESRIQLKSSLEKYYHSDNLQEKRIIAIKQGNQIQIELNRVFGKNPLLFSEFIKKMILSESEVYNYVHENLLPSNSLDSFDEYTLFRSQFPQLKSENSKDQNIELLRQANLYETTEEVEKFIENQNIDMEKVFSNKLKTTASNLVDGLFKLIQAKLSLSNFEIFISKGLSKNSLSSMIETLNSSIENLRIKHFLANIVEKKTHRIQISRNDEEYLTGVCTNYINDFISNFGFNKMTEERIAELRLVSNELNLNLDALIHNKPQPVKNELIPLFDYQEHTGNNSALLEFNPMIENYNKYISMFKVALISNCGFINYDVNANNELVNILKRVDVLNINIQ